MMVGPDLFKQGMRRLGGAVSIINTTGEGRDAGLTATSVTSLSLEPARLLACINANGESFELINRSRLFAVHVLSVEQRGLAMRFAGYDHENESERFDEKLWQRSASGVFLLKDALVSFECTLEDMVLMASHGIAIGNITAVYLGEAADKAPLFYREGAWARLAPLD